jgi:hypothetical protein
VPKLAFLVALGAAAVLAVPASAQAPSDTSVQFTLGRVVRLTPDGHDRIGIRSTCSEPTGCTIDYTLKRGSTLLGGIEVMLLGNTVETDYVTLSKRTAAALRKRRMNVTITAQVRDAAGNRALFTKLVVLGPKKKRR